MITEMQASNTDVLVTCRDCTPDASLMLRSKQTVTRRKEQTAGKGNTWGAKEGKYASRSL